jgi:predicted KAP-like P-loop ATPase
VDEAVLAKMLLFERIGDPKAYASLTKAVTETNHGKPEFLADWEEKVNAGQDLQLPVPWAEPFVKEWLQLPPRLASVDLRGVLYVSREHTPLISPQDRLSSEAAELLTALLQTPEMAGSIKNKFAKISRAEITIIMDRLLDRAQQVQEWGVPPILEACLVAAKADVAQGSRLAAFLSERPVAQIKPNIIPKIAEEPWAPGVLEKWERALGISGPVKNAIKQRINGNIGIK